MDLNTVQQFTKEYFGITATAKQLVGHEDLNYFLKADNDAEFILKIAHHGQQLDILEMQNQVMNHLESKHSSLSFPRVISNKNDDDISIIKDEHGNDRFARLLTWVPGRLWSHVNPHRENLLENLGHAIGSLSYLLSDFDHPFAHRNFKWDISQAEWIEKYFDLFEGKHLELVRYFYDLFRNIALPKLEKLPKSVCHNDANDYNILVSFDRKKPKVLGLIDFGDLIYTNTINELAIAIAYAILDKPDPLSAAASVVKGFHKKNALKAKELEVLFPLIAARLLISVTFAAIGKKENPENEYLLISEKPAWALLEKLRNISPNLAYYTFRNACGLAPCSKNNLFKNWLRTQKTDFSKIVSFNENSGKVHWLDLAVGSQELGNNIEFEDRSFFDKKIKRILEDAGADFGVGGYGEVRSFYTTDAFQVEGNNGPVWRTIHLGTDIWASAGTSIFAPLAGKIHSFQNNAGDCNYGPTIILEHVINSSLTFYTLYGHLTLESLDGLSEGDEFEEGQEIARIGDISENGNWPPHLHFQVMLDMLGLKGDFPGVAFPEQAYIWKSICPDPKLLLHFKKNTPQQQLTNDTILKKREKFLPKNLSISYQNPLHVVRGFKQYLYDESGRRFLDTVNNVPHVGHQHPRVVKAAQNQMAILNTNTRYLHENIVQYAEELLATFPKELNVCFFVNSGSEANELALRMAQNFSNQKDMIAVEVGYHGNTGACIDISSYKFDGKGGKGAPKYTHIVPIPDTYRGLYKKDDPGASKKYASHVKRVIEKVKSEGRNIAGFICESILSCGGQIVLPEGYLKEVYGYVREVGGLCIVDEVQVGFGRVGEKFWAFELQGVVPDIVTLGKPMGNGHPLAAVITTAKVAEAFTNGMEYFNTFGGNPVSCAIGREVLQIIKDEQLQENALQVGNYLLKVLEELKQKYEIIGDVRGKGLFLGFELVKDRATLEPAEKEAAWLANRMRENGILMSTDGPFHNVLKIKPPMCFSKENVNFFAETLDSVLSEDFFVRS